MSFASRAFALACLLLASGCTIGRWYVGSPLRADPDHRIVAGTTGKAEVLSTFGPPDRILRQRSGDVFVYRYDQRNSSELNIGTPPFIGIGSYQIFRWTHVQDKSDHLMVFFDRAGVVSSFGYRTGRIELKPL
jgi:hypothetical protein